jgi:uncharacterized membrane protein
MSDQFSTAPSDVTSDDKLWAAGGYILSPIGPIIILLMEDKKNRPFLKYHAVTALAWAAVGAILSIIGVGLCIWPVGNIVLAIMAYQGKLVEIPVLTDFVKKQGWL